MLFAMCGRYGLKLQLEDVALAAAEEGLAVSPMAPEIRDAFDATRDLAPTDLTPVLTRPGADLPLLLGLARWGLVREAPPARPSLVINARAETLRSRPLFRGGRPALVPASGWFEWATPAGQPPSRRVPHWIHRRSQHGGTEALVFFAGLVWGDDPARQVILTRPPVPAIAHIHDRMPAVVDGPAAKAWLGGDLTPAALMDLGVEDLAVTLTEPRVGPRPPQPRQLDLFGEG
jgi:putative SOS response-associated peptidase YedK